RIGVAKAVPAAHFRFFSRSSFWNTPLPADAELDPASSQLAGAFAAEVEREARAGSPPWINTTDYSVPIYRVPLRQPVVRVELSSRYRAPALQAAWRRVPLPADAQPAAGTDHSLVVWQPSRDRLWEFWRLERSAGGWRASWGGTMRNVSSNPGVYGPRAWPGAKPWWGSSASSLSIAGGLITFPDLRAGYIDHALAMAVPKVRTGVFASPARRTDGTATGPSALPEGAHLRLDPNLDLASLHLPRLTWMIASAAQRYGIFVRDRARVAHFFAQDPTPLRGDPYSGPNGYFEGRSPGELLASFPWSHLQVLPMKLHRFVPQPAEGPP
ncbi:MAG TPA: hypothetical protein VFP23_10615, partial [Solirubrobacterales bacterium]|nr:hypothetical protein [Solirubrobacterales bacterium]